MVCQSLDFRSESETFALLCSEAISVRKGVNYELIFSNVICNH